MQEEELSTDVPQPWGVRVGLEVGLGARRVGNRGVRALSGETEKVSSKKRHWS